VNQMSNSGLQSHDQVFINGLGNSFKAAIRNGTTQTTQVLGRTTDYVLFFNRSEGLFKDVIEASQDIISTYTGSGASSLAKNLSQSLDYAGLNGVTGVSLIGHSQGAAITTSALRYAADNGLSLNAVRAVNLHGAPLNDGFVTRLLSNRIAATVTHRSQFSDAVNAILGANFISNPLRLPVSLVRSPYLFSSDAGLSAHTTPCGTRVGLCKP